MLDYESKEAIYKCVDMLLYVKVFAIEVNENEVSFRCQIIEPVYTELNNNGLLNFKQGYNEDHPQPIFSIVYGMLDLAVVLDNYWQFPYLNIALNFNRSVINKFKNRQRNWMEEMY
ncbi:hypothetical protein [Anabaena lutea]|uniref:Uncharacterized protein n=1 Tax=Anabaena lutea FACHB-196 TaxID=2692881 RepID=A0ABR8FN21_9NOST|nr:hypothetical protein [Anabaena lutea]MBD2570502.1 hypothetical protein [Anabaena lutea FACHB-196]